MSIIESSRQLEEQASSRLRELVTELHQEARDRLENEFSAQLEQIRHRAAEHSETLSRAASDVAGREGRTAGLTAVRDGLRHIDLATSQAGVLAALLSSTENFSSRAALFLLRGEQATGWNGQGFVESAVQGLSISTPGAPFARLVAEQSALRLEADEAAAITDPLEAVAPARAVLVPMVLRDKLAATLYADRVDGDGSLEAEALQVLVYAAAQAIEVLPYRERTSTSTLALSPELAPEADSDDSEPDVGVQPATEPNEAVVVEATVDEASVDDAPELTTWQGEVAPELQPAVAVADADADQGVDAVEAVEAVATAVEPEPEDAITTEPVAAEPLEADAVTAQPPSSVHIEESANRTSEIEIAEVEVEDESLQEVEVEIEAAPRAVEQPPEVSTESLQTMVIPSTAALGAETPLEAADPDPVPQQEPTPAPEDGDSTTLLQRPLHTAAPEPAPAPTTSGNPLFNQPAGTKDSQVTPPSDLDGPGLAFGAATSSSDDSFEGDEQHDKAKRLARLLVSEIKLYNEEEVEEGRRNGNIYARLREDIDRSRQMYEDRVDERVRNAKDYFYQELVRTLASGDAQVLGL